MKTISACVAADMNYNLWKINKKAEQVDFQPLISILAYVPACKSESDPLKNGKIFKVFILHFRAFRINLFFFLKIK